MGADANRAAGGFFDSVGRNPFDRMAGRLAGDGGNGGNGGSYAYSGMSSRWDPASGGAGLNSNNFSGTQFAHVGLDLPTTKSLFAKGFNQQQIIAAAADVKNLGFSPKDKAAVEDHAIIRKFAKNPDEINNHLKGFRDSLLHNEEYQGLVHQLQQAKTPEERKRILAQMQPIEHKAAEEHHVNHDKHDTRNPSNVRGAVERDEKRLLRQLHHEKSVTHKKHAAADAKAAKAEVKVAKANNTVANNEAAFAALQKRIALQSPPAASPSESAPTTPPAPQNQHASASPPAQDKPVRSAALQKPANPII